MVMMGTSNDASPSKKHIEWRVAWNPCYPEASDAAIAGTPREKGYANTRQKIQFGTCRDMRSGVTSTPWIAYREYNSRSGCGYHAANMCRGHGSPLGL